MHSVPLACRPHPHSPPCAQDAIFRSSTDLHPCTLLGEAGRLAHVPSAMQSPLDFVQVGGLGLEWSWC